MGDDDELIDIPVELTPEARRDLYDKLRDSGMADGVCCMCTRPFLARSELRLCPPCRVGKPDGWNPAFTVRLLELGKQAPDPTLPPCPNCKGVGVVGWLRGMRAAPRCSTCRGRGQLPS